ncbi:putative metal-dependent enzyme of the double-stranded beta helix superfamily [Leptolyngbyaceae cyanobacterium JSC-12]|nr:putative metal-dependent enzyme of the double-stranded beta helix superfamily [Leptolyngbyaceae cyanobacterium JSC-12]
MVNAAMKYRDLLVTAAGQWQVCKPAREWDLLRTPYRFHRFLTEVEDVLEAAITEVDCIPQLRLLVRRLITNSYWIQTQYAEPNPDTGSGVMMLYDEIGYPLTVQITTYLPGTRSIVHNHGNWGIVAVLKGEEKNTIWKRLDDPQFPNRVEPTAEVIILPGDIISFTPDAIHSVEAVGDEPTVTFSLYGETHHSKRFEFDPITHTAKNF